jgi:hypothetical protein
MPSIFTVHGRTGSSCAGAEQNFAAAEGEMLRRDLALGNLPAAAANDVH